MKTLYININNECIRSNDELEVLNYDLDSDFFFYLGERIAKGCRGQNENALITDFNTPDNKQDYDAILSQWNDIKKILFGENVEGGFKFVLPSGYIHWLRYHEDYNHVYEANFSNDSAKTIAIDLTELYEDTIDDMQRNIMRKLQRDDLYLDIDEVVFNDENVTRKSPIVCAIQERYKAISFTLLKERSERENKKQLEKERLYREQQRQQQYDLRERERLEKERQERLEQEKKISGQFLSYDEYYIFRVVYPKVFFHSYDSNKTDEKRYLLLRLRDKMQDILNGKTFCINRYDAETLANSPFSEYKGPKLTFTSKDFSKMHFFSKLCRESKSYGVDWFFDETMLDEVFCTIWEYPYRERPIREIKIPYTKSYDLNVPPKVMYRSTIWYIQNSEHSFEAHLRRILKY